MVVFGLETGTALVFALVVLTIVLFVTEALPPDTTAVGLIVVLALFEPWTQVGPVVALSGFSNAATVTILAMYVLSRGIQETGIVRRLGAEVARVTRGDENRLLVATIALAGPIAGVINNTPVVAVFIPMVSELAEEAGVSPSKLLIPLSYASMLGGTLTLIGTATNLVASDLSAQLIGRPFSMFEFTALGAVVLVVGGAYLLTVGRALLPSRVPAGGRTERYGVEEYLARVLVPARSPLVGTPVAEVSGDVQRDLDLDVLDVVRGAEHFVAADSDRDVEARDILTVRGSPTDIRRFCRLADLRYLPGAAVGDEELGGPATGTLVEVVVPSNSDLVGETVGGARLRERYDATVLAIRRAGGELVREAFREVELRAGDAILLQTTAGTASYLHETPDLVVTSELIDVDGMEPLDVPRTLTALGIVGAVVATAALGLAPIVIAALGGVVAMVATGVLSTSDAYESVNWTVIFLLAGVIPLGVALRETGGAALLAELVVASAGVVPPVVVLGLFYVLTGLLANVITPVASVVLLLPIAVRTAESPVVGADPFAFVLAVTFAASTAFMTPVGYQTNLMVYGPGGYRFTDYVRVGAPLQLLLAVVTTVGIALLWGLQPTG
ncbi:SLC13 family permease [Halobium salinum]|uniref:SLC13 family permease n=1 Tax=Halobium salinum TaxID=1364940 RepID=A0ABD5PBF4_9EURY|nr:SLC13 family permease [Halobium salinum]